MVSPEHVNEQKFANEQVPDPAVEQSVVPAGEKKRPWIEPLLRGVAIVVSLISGGVFYWLMVESRLPYLENPPSNRLDFLRLIAVLLVCLVALGGAVLFRSWWAILVVPLAIGLGALIVMSQGAKFFPPISDENLVYMVYGAAAMESWLVMPPTVIIGAGIGSYLGVLWKKGWKR